MMRKSVKSLLFLALLSALGGCSGKEPANSDAGTLRVVTTIGMIADLASTIAGERAEVRALMGPGVDPHLFKASEGDVRRLAEADLVLYNGLHLEGKMIDVLVRMARSRPVVAVSEGLSEDVLREPPEFEGQYDPHVWFDVELWSGTVDVIVRELSALSPEHAAEFATRGEELRAELLALDGWVHSRIAEIPPGRRVLVTAHDAFGYFGEAYGVEVVALQGLSTLAEAGLTDVERVVNVVVDKSVPAIFVESSVSPRAIEAVRAAVASRGREVRIGGELFSDAMGAKGSPEGTYAGMVRHNVDTIVEALR